MHRGRYAKLCIGTLSGHSELSEAVVQRGNHRRAADALRTARRFPRVRCVAGLAAVRVAGKYPANWVASSGDLVGSGVSVIEPLGWP